MFKVVILGHGEMLANLIAGALDAKCKIVGVLRYERMKKNPILLSIKDFINPSTEYNYIKSYNLPEIKVKSANSEEFKRKILELNPDLILVGTWGEKLKKEIIQLPKIAMINAHPSLLPLYRGPNPYLQTIKNMEKQSGITFHLMTEEFDAGAILTQKAIEILPDDTGKELKKRTVLAARSVLTDLLNSLAEDFVIPVEQNEQRATYQPQITQKEVMLDFKKSAEELHAYIRAFSPWSKTFFEHDGTNVFFYPNAYHLEILENNTEFNKVGEIVSKSAKNCSLTVVCGDGKLLKMSKLKLYGRFRKFFTSQYIKFAIKEHHFVS